ncbi:hypothetical protein DdX_20829 [Ditylenchus destructor]|uniref:Uncharacterized protein n=1 Tax=Ditylenchus destructor TaxID=166010 RepID=A0AAD4MFP2_9BILA|nr:hypothetical protein DdX_20829 [Ditylenchus destructor]
MKTLAVIILIGLCAVQIKCKPDRGFYGIINRAWLPKKLGLILKDDSGLKVSESWIAIQSQEQRMNGPILSDGSVHEINYSINFKSDSDGPYTLDLAHKVKKSGKMLKQTEVLASYKLGKVKEGEEKQFDIIV